MGLLTFPGAQRLRPVVAFGLEENSDFVQVAEASLALVGAEEAELLLAMCLWEGVEDVVHLWGRGDMASEGGRSSVVRSQP